MKIFGLGAILRWRDVSGEPLSCAIAFTVLSTFTWILMGTSFDGIVLHAVLALAISSMYFYALEYIAGGPIYWLILIVGFPLLIVI